MREPLGIGLAGMGGFGTFCLAAYAAMPEVTVTAVADLDRARAEAAAAPGTTIYTDYARMVADPAVHIVAINTPPHLHARMARDAIAAGKHVLVEKPLATTLDDARTVITAAQAAGVQITVDFVLRYHPLHQLAAQVVHSGALGAFRHWSLENFATDETLLPGHWFWDPAQSGGIHVEHGVHFFDLCNHLAQATPTHVSGYSQRRADGREDRVSATVRYGDSVLATFYHTFNQVRAVEQTTIRIGCERGHITLEGWIPTRLALHGLVDDKGLNTLVALFPHMNIHERYQGEQGIFQHGGCTDRLVALVSAETTAPDRQADYRRGIQAVMRDLVNAVRGEQSLTVTAEDGLLALAIALAASNHAAWGPPFAL
ncbi:MAG: Gfo/Idh/MocA family oxidoreductase [Chloroflexi bacterium]|nr:Gfo/Idh/MocA family oxidoreductase [Chloroflexota bacterium]